MHQTCSLGKYLRERYFTNLSYLTDTPDESELLLRSTDIDRTLLSGTSVFSCLFYLLYFVCMLISYSRLGFFPSEFTQTETSSEVSTGSESYESDQSDYSDESLEMPTKLITIPVDTAPKAEEFLLRGYTTWFALISSISH